jgi:hypothetical protein
MPVAINALTSLPLYNTEALQQIRLAINLKTAKALGLMK